MNHSKQRGGTVLGVIIGVVLGLAVALAVALYVAKVPVPFISKKTPPTGDDAQAEIEKNRDWDPNAALRGRGPARPIGQGGEAVSGGALAPQVPTVMNGGAATSPNVSTAAPTSLPQTGTRVPEPVPPAVVARPTVPSPSVTPDDDPLGKFAASRLSAKPVPLPAPVGTPAAPVADRFAYFVQAGAFRASADAETQRARLSLQGVQAKVTEREQAGRTVYRVRVGPFQNRDAAELVKSRLTRSGLDAALVRVQK